MWAAWFFLAAAGLGVREAKAETPRWVLPICLKRGLDRAIDWDQFLAERARLQTELPAQGRASSEASPPLPQQLRGAPLERKLALLQLLAERSGTDALLELERLAPRPGAEPSPEARARLRALSDLLSPLDRGRALSDRQARALVRELYALTHFESSRIPRWARELIPQPTEAMIEAHLARTLLETDLVSAARELGLARRPGALDALARLDEVSGLTDWLGFASARSFARTLVAAGPLGKLPPVQLLRLRRLSPELARLIRTEGLAAARERAHREFGALASFQRAWKAAETAYLVRSFAILATSALPAVRGALATAREAGELLSDEKRLAREREARERALRAWLAANPSEAEVYLWARNALEFLGQLPDPENAEDVEDYLAIREAQGRTGFTREQARQELREFLSARFGSGARAQLR